MSDAGTGGRRLEARPVAAADGDLQFALYCQSRAAEFVGCGWDEQQLEQFLRMQYQARCRHYAAAFPEREELVILEDGEAAGYMIVAHGETADRLVDIAVLPARRGRGIAAAMIGRLQSEAATAGRPLRLHVYADNPAYLLYQKLGFTLLAGGDGYSMEMEWRATGTA